MNPCANETGGSVGDFRYAILGNDTSSCDVYWPAVVALYALNLIAALLLAAVAGNAMVDAFLAHASARPFFATRMNRFLLLCVMFALITCVLAGVKIGLPTSESIGLTPLVTTLSLVCTAVLCWSLHDMILVFVELSIKQSKVALLSQARVMNSLRNSVPAATGLNWLGFLFTVLGIANRELGDLFFGVGMTIQCGALVIAAVALRYSFALLITDLEAIVHSKLRHSQDARLVGLIPKLTALIRRFSRLRVHLVFQALGNSAMLLVIGWVPPVRHFEVYLYPVMYLNCVGLLATAIHLMTSRGGDDEEEEAEGEVARKGNPNAVSPALGV